MAQPAAALTGADPASHPQVSFIVVNWNRRAHLERCLDSLQRQTMQNFELVLVDNGSTDGSLDSLPQFSLPACQVIRNQRNVGFGPAVNQGIRAARGCYLALVNNDVVLDPHWLEEILRGFERDARVGMCAGKILLAEQPGRIDKVGHLLYPDGQNYGRGHREQDQGQYDQAEEALWPDGAAAIYRAEVFAEVGGFDDDFFAYGDDAELGLRARLCGWTCYYIPTAVAHHHHSATLGEYAPAKIFLVERNRIWLVLKLFPFSQLVQVPFYSAVRYLYSVWALLTGQGPVGRTAREGSVGGMLWAVVRAQFAALAGLPRMLGKRRAIRRRRRVSTGEFRRLLQKYAVSARQLTLQG